MKKILATVITGSMLLALTACASTPEATTEVTTTTTTTTAESETTTTTTTSETTTETTFDFPLEEYSRVNIDAVGGIAPSDLASDFDYGSNAIYEVWFDENAKIGYPCAPNYPAGEDIVIKFKSKEDYFDFGSIIKCDPEIDRVMADFDENTIYIAAIQSEHNANTDKWKYSSNIKDFLKYDNGTYTLTIPAEYVETSYSFYIRLSNEPYGFTGGDTEKGSMVDITVRCMEPMK